ncbi:hypothetical protein VDGL01_11208 [Verticillium dahliae]
MQQQRQQQQQLHKAPSNCMRQTLPCLPIGPSAPPPLRRPPTGSLEPLFAPVSCPFASHTPAGPAVGQASTTKNHAPQSDVREITASWTSPLASRLSPLVLHLLALRLQRIAPIDDALPLPALFAETRPESIPHKDDNYFTLLRRETRFRYTYPALPSAVAAAAAAAAVQPKNSGSSSSGQPLS